MGDPADIGPQYQCEDCGVWSPDTTCMQCGAELDEMDYRRGVEGELDDAEPAAPSASVTGGDVTYIIDCRVTIDGVDLDKLNGAALDDYASMCGHPTRRAPKKDGNQ